MLPESGFFFKTLSIQQHTQPRESAVVLKSCVFFFTPEFFLPSSIEEGKRRCVINGLALSFLGEAAEFFVEAFMVDDVFLGD